MRWRPLRSDRGDRAPSRPGSAPPDRSIPLATAAPGISTSRREFLSTLAVPIVASAAGALGAAACGQARPTPYDPSQFVLPSRSTMGIFPAANYAVDFADLITRGFRELGVSVAGKRVLLKPNMVEYEP